MGKFSSNIDVTTGKAGSTDTNYSSRSEYMKEMANAMLYLLENNPVIKGHVNVRQQRSLKACWKLHLGPMVEGASA